MGKTRNTIEVTAMLVTVAASARTFGLRSDDDVFLETSPGHTQIERKECAGEQHLLCVEAMGTNKLIVKDELKTLAMVAKTGNYDSALDNSRGSLPVCTEEVNPLQLRWLLPAEELWASWAHQLEVDLTGGWKYDRENLAPKALTLLLVEPNGEGISLERLQDAVAAALPRCLAQDCLLFLDGSTFAEQEDFKEARGELQQLLARFLMRCPHGVVSLRGLQAMQVEVLPALQSAVSESGAYTYNGRAVPSTGATFILTAELPKAAMTSCVSDEDRCSQDVKSALEAHWQGAREYETTSAVSFEDALTYARAFRRRIDFVAPMRS
eukprot:gene2654-3421_t